MRVSPASTQTARTLDDEQSSASSANDASNTNSTNNTNGVELGDPLFWLTFRLASVGIAVISPNGFFMRANPELCRLLDYTEEQMQALTFHQVTHPDDLLPMVDLHDRFLTGELAGARVEIRFMRQDGEMAWVDLSETLVRDGVGKPLFFLAIVIDITARRWAEAQLVEVRSKYLEMLREHGTGSGYQVHSAGTSPLTDPLTGLHNRRAADDMLITRLSSVRSSSFPVGCVVVDVDGFTQINEKFGKAFGDAVLKKIANMLQASCRDDDFLARYDGDKFLVILPNTNPAGTIILGEKLIRNVRESDWSSMPLVGSVTISAGATCVNYGSGLTLAELMGILDSQLEQAKEGGRDRMVMNTRQITGKLQA